MLPTQGSCYLDPIRHRRTEADRCCFTTVGPEQARAETHWWYNPKYTIQELNVNSAICKPGHDETVPISTTPSYTFRGYAYAGGGRRIHRVEVSLDEGATWTLAEIE